MNKPTLSGIASNWTREPGLVQRQRRATEEAMRLHRKQIITPSVMADWSSLTVYEQEGVIERAQAEESRQARERRELSERERDKARIRHLAVRDVVTDPTLRSVVELHCPTDDCITECTGCPTGGDSWGDEQRAEWPCATFLLIEDAARVSDSASSL